MNKIMLNTIKAGTVFSEALYLDDGENMFLPARTAISSNELELLQNKAILYLYTDGEEIQFANETNEESDTLNNTSNSELDSAFAVASTYTVSRDSESVSPVRANYESVEQESEEFSSLSSLKNTEEYTDYIILIKNCQRIFDSVKTRERLSSTPVSKIVQDLFSLVDKHADLCVALILENDIQGFEMAKSAIDVASLAYLIASYMQVTNEKIHDITIAALLHDIGMIMVNPEILEKTEKLNDAEMQAIENHCIYGYNCLVNEFMYPDRIAKIVMQHHEWYDGSGYPGRLSGNEIDLGARILACADAFVAMTSKKPYRKAMLAYEAMKALLNDNGIHFDPNVVNALIRSIGIFPIGSMVLLSDSSLCRVIKSVPDFPLRPQLRLLIDEHGTVHDDSENKIINLQVQKNLFITQAIDPELITC